jgi:hypothetical protein
MAYGAEFEAEPHEIEAEVLALYRDVHSHGKNTAGRTQFTNRNYGVLNMKTSRDNSTDTHPVKSIPATIVRSSGYHPMQTTLPHWY